VIEGEGREGERERERDGERDRDALGGLTTVNILLFKSIVTQISLETTVFNVVVMVTRRYAA